MTVATANPMTSPSAAPVGIDASIEVPKAVRSDLTRGLAASRDRIVASWYKTQFDPARIAQYGIVGTERQSREAFERSFLEPLFRLMAHVVASGDEMAAAVYRDERLRYAPHRESIETRVAFFRELLPMDEHAVFEALDRELRAPMASLLAALHAPLVASIAGKPLRLLALGDCLISDLRVFLPGRCHARGFTLDMRGLYFSALTGRTLPIDDTLEYLDKHPADVIATSFLTYEGIPPYSTLLREADRLTDHEIASRVDAIVGVMHEYLTGLRARTDCTFLVHNASGLPLTRWRHHLPLLPAHSSRRLKALTALNAAIHEMSANVPRVIPIDEYAVAGAHGIRRCALPAVPANVAHGGMFHPTLFGSALADAYLPVLDAHRRLSRTKVLLLDFDNTLWDGVMAEGTVRHHKDRQAMLKRLKDAGILLVAVSKNDPNAIRWQEIGLQREDFVLLKISWGLKAEAIAATAQQLDLGLDSFVFVDDSPQERELVRQTLPAVHCLDATADDTWTSLAMMLAFPNARETQESKTRTELYRQQAERRASLDVPVDYDQLMTSLQLTIRFRRIAAADLDRVVELIQRTNQFNTTTIRYTRAELAEQMRAENRAIYVAELKDKFGTLGLVSVVIVERRDDASTLDSFVMSCRAMGFQLERAMLDLVAQAEGTDRRLIGRFVPTDRNMPARNLYSDAGFTASGDQDWVLDVGTAIKPGPAWFTVQR